jgi:septal ring factor EnvC (AmiA/AmiB activator)
MIKVLFILSAVLMLVATIFAYQNGRTLADVRSTKAAKHQTIKTEQGALTGMVDQINQLIADVTRVEGELDVEREKQKAQKLKIAQAEGEIKRTQDELDANNKRLAEMRADLDGLPPDVKPETLQEDLNRIKQAIAELKANAEAKQTEVDTEIAKVKSEQRVVDGLARKREERQKAFERNSLEATIVAVNSDWGFVVVNAGQPEGIAESTKLIVTRGTQTIGKISIISVSGSRTVANIMPETSTPGYAIAPGDTVILENLFQ